MIGVYIHIPFCNNICSYCDFSKVYYKEDIVNKYLESLNYEIDNNYKNEKINTIYIGGGTPSCLNIQELNKLFKIINNHFDLKNLEEFTIECNIESITEEKLIMFKNNHINRLSIGIQSFDKNILKYLNRCSNIDIISKTELCKKYFDNINIDLLYGIKNMDIKTIKRDLETYISLNLKHISYYSLIIEPHTKLYIDNTKEIDEDSQYEMYNLINKTLKNNNYIHYETSNYCMIGYESKHNLKYWNNEYYYGFGLNACSFINNIRTSNTKNLNKYINKNYDKTSILEDINLRESNEMILGLRKLEGVNKEKFYNKYNTNIEDKYDIKDLIDSRKLIDDSKTIRINEDYIYLSNEILIRFID